MFLLALHHKHPPYQILTCINSYGWVSGNSNEFGHKESKSPSLRVNHFQITGYARHHSEVRFLCTTSFLAKPPFTTMHDNNISRTGTFIKLLFLTYLLNRWAYLPFGVRPTFISILHKWSGTLGQHVCSFVTKSGHLSFLVSIFVVIIKEMPWYHFQNGAT